jgi:serpin B
MKRRVLPVLLVGLAIGCSNTSSSPTPAGPKPGEPTAIPAPPEVPAADVRTAAQGDLAFAADLHRKIGGDGNLVYSPASVSLALAMTYAGAAGKTAEEMKTVLHFTLDPEKLHAVNHKRLYTWNGGGKEHRPYELSVADSLWGQKGEPWKKEFTELLKTRYAAGLREVDFAADPEAARGPINQWAADWTHNKIPELVPPGVLTGNTRLVLANAVYFKGAWASKFDKERTAQSPFQAGGTKEVPVQMMYQRHHFGYGATADAQLLEMPFEGHRLALVVILPNKKDGLPALEASLSPVKLNELLGRILHGDEVEVYLPRFKFESSLDLARTLAAMGMPSAFAGGAADFSGMDGTRDLFIGSVIHKATVEINEEGGEAAAATAVEVGVKSEALPKDRQTPVFRADHPFLFLIRDRETGEILFLGRVADPSK